MGADRGTHLVADGELDSAAVSALLAGVAAGYDVVLTGKQAQDSDAGLAGAMLAERLGLPYVTNAVGLSQEGGADGSPGTIVVTRLGDAGQETVALPTPCLVTCSNDMNDPRIPTLKGIMAAKRKPVDTRPVTDAPAARVRTLGYEPLPARAAGRRLEGDSAAQAAEVVRLLADEASVL